MDEKTDEQTYIPIWIDKEPDRWIDINEQKI